MKKTKSQFTATATEPYQNRKFHQFIIMTSTVTPKNQKETMKLKLLKELKVEGTLVHAFKYYCV